MTQYHLIINKHQQPPIEESEMVEAFRAGKYPQGTLAWCAGMDGWKPIETLPVITGKTEPPPIPEDLGGSEQPPTPENPGEPPTPDIRNTGKLVSEKLTVVKNYTDTFIKEKKWKSFTKKQWGVIGGVCAGVLLLAGGLLYLFPGDLDSDPAIKKYLDNKVKQVRKYDRDTAVSIKKKVGSMKRSLKEDGGQAGRRELVACLGAWGEVSAMEYLFEEKDFDADLADIALVSAAHAGQTGVVKYLVKNDYCSGDEAVYDRAYKTACRYGKLSVCKYLVDDCEVRVKDEHLTELLTLTSDDYKETAKDLSAFQCKEIKSDRVMKEVAEVAAYLMKRGARLDMDDTRVKSALQNCPNPHLKELFP